MGMADTGKTKMTVDELGNLQLQYSRKLGIFQCDNWQVFSDGDAELAPGVPFVKVYDVVGDFHFAKRKETGSWINTGLHAAAWKAIGEAGINGGVLRRHHCRVWGLRSQDLH